MKLHEAALSADGTLGSAHGRQHETVERLRALIRADAPGLLENVRWKLLVYEGRGPVAALLVYDAYVHLAFFEGARLRVAPDMVERSGAREPQSLLRGVADRMRWLRYDSAAAVDEETVRGLLLQALALDGQAAGAP